MMYNFFNKKKKIETEEDYIYKHNDETWEKKDVEFEENKPQDGYVSVIDNEIIVKDPINNGKKAQIMPSPEIILKINNERVLKKCEICSSDNIEFEFEVNNAKRKLDIRTSVDKLTATIDIKYIPSEILKLKDKEEALTIELESEIQERVFPKRFSEEELIEAVKAKGIVNGMIDENISAASMESEVTGLTIVQGKAAADDEDDEIKYFFPVSKSNLLEESSDGSIDYKSIGHVKPILQGQVLCQLIKGKEGEDGVDIFGNVLKKKPGKRLSLGAGEHTAIENNKLISLIDGKAYLNNGKVNVVKVHEITTNVDISTGNISFIGDIIIHGEVKDNMKVIAGHGVEIYKSIHNSLVAGEGNIKINENVIHSKVISGGINLEKANIVKELLQLQSYLQELYNDIVIIRENNLMSKNITDGQLVMILLEKKYKNAEKLCKKLVQHNKYIIGKLIIFLKIKLIDIAPLNIKHYTEISEIIECLDENSKLLSYELDQPGDIEISYCQDSEIQCTGSIYITGKGEYVSNITANDSVTFTKSSSIARGGLIIATNIIKCGIVGSEVGVVTTLRVGEFGHIYAEIVYFNTKFVVGSREYTFDKSFKQVHAYLDKSRDLIIDKFVL